MDSVLSLQAVGSRRFVLSFIPDTFNTARKDRVVYKPYGLVSP
uniref:Uncharacterized protein n=1 Tax=Physcomitrium patens TaxID=3218 RepID=A0A2K1IC97_PHYPA|nr:hypothetical protein PHYPA_030370 [Physcomitrium patens]